MDDEPDITAHSYPETAAGGFTSVDGTVEFYSRVNALLHPGDHVLDFGAGRASWFTEDTSTFRRDLRSLRGKVERVVACDVDPAVRENTAADETVVMTSGEPLPFPNGTFQIIVADYVLEHLDDPHATARELARILDTGGWLCARTPNKWGYISIMTRAVPSRRHRGILAKAQPARQSRDVFPTRFKLNTMRALRTAFPQDRFAHHSYYYEPEPAYYYGRSWLFTVMKTLNAVLPRSLRSNLFVFIQKRQAEV